MRVWCRRAEGMWLGPVFGCWALDVWPRSAAQRWNHADHNSHRACGGITVERPTLRLGAGYDFVRTCLRRRWDSAKPPSISSTADVGSGVGTTLTVPST